MKGRHMTSSSKQYDMTVHPTAGLVRSASDGASAHHVTLASCDCADFINRKGRLVEVDGGIVAVTVCKHVAEFLERAGGWHRAPEPLPEMVTLNRLTRAQAFTHLTSAYMAADLVDRLLHAAVGASPIAATVRITVGDVMVKYDSTNRRYTITMPASQPVSLPAGHRG
jgi:hypothetical protein